MLKIYRKLVSSMLPEPDGESYEDSADETEDPPWITWFCSLAGNEFFCEAQEEYVQDDFNLVGLRKIFPDFDLAIELILDLADQTIEKLTENQQKLLEQSAEQLYGLIHARYIVTSQGLAAMSEKFQQKDFGTCPRVYCEDQACLPVGMSDVYGEAPVKIYCPRCRDVYTPRSKRHREHDGAFWGTTFPHLFLLTYPYLVPNAPVSSYLPRIFGFRIATEEEYEEVVAREAAGIDTSTIVRPAIIAVEDG